jgi:hypothetical protein
MRACGGNTGTRGGGPINCTVHQLSLLDAPASTPGCALPVVTSPSSPALLTLPVAGVQPFAFIAPEPSGICL